MCIFVRKMWGRFFSYARGEELSASGKDLSIAKTELSAARQEHPAGMTGADSAVAYTNAIPPKEVRTVVKDHSFYGKGLPYLQIEALPGTFIVIEGSDYSGRSTQTQLLKYWLEANGHAVLDIGIKRSQLISAAIEKAQQGNQLGKKTFSLLYATDFADQLENRILPALKAGFVVVADRYIYTLMARDLVRGAEKAWLEELYGMAVIPDMIFFLDVPPEELLHRGFLKMGHLSYWESGMDLGLSTDMFESFHKYQEMISRQFKILSKQYHFTHIDGTQSIPDIQNFIRQKVEKMLEN